MRKVRGLVLLGIVAVAGQPALAQERPALEVFTGGSFARNSNTNFGGWNAAVNANVNSWLGITADFSGHYNDPLSLYTYTFGPHVAIAQDTGLVPYMHATFGAARIAAFGLSDTGFGAYIGGGLDWIPRDYLAVRFLQLDAQLTRISGSNNNGTRLSFGVVWRLGRR
jgi:hypothetical protein